jgi:hypothetical protein
VGGAGDGSGGSGSGGVLIIGSGGRAAGGAPGAGGVVIIGAGGALLGGRSGAGGVIGAGGRTGSGGATGAVCTSMTNWNGVAGPTMEPGVACNSCHNHAFTIAGTIYATAHEPNLCNGDGASGLRVVITGADGRTLTLTPSSAGDFYSTTAVATPFTAKITNGTASRAMAASQTSGDCNSCHTQNGANGAPGRIMAP